MSDAPAPPPERPAAPDVRADDLGDRARRRVRRRLLPFLMLLYVVAFLDRVNVNFAALAMGHDLGFGPREFGFGAGVFFLGYFLFEIPGTLIVERWSARRWMTRILISWGLVAAAMSLVKTPTQFYALRFFLGLAEAGFFPGIIVYLTHWFPAPDRAKAMGLFTVALPISNMLGAPISGLLLGVHWAGLAGWRWLFIIEGAPAVILGVVTFFFLTDRPQAARWLPPDERAWMVDTLAAEAARRPGATAHRFGVALGDRRVWLLSLAYFLVVVPSYGFQLWLPQVVRNGSNLSSLGVSLVVDLAYVFGLPSLLLFGWSSDRSRERRWHAAIPIRMLSSGLCATALLQGHWPAVLLGLILAGAGLNAHLPAFWALPPTFLGGSAAAGSIGLINSIGNLGGFVGPYLVGFLKEGRSSFAPGLVALAIFGALASAMILTLRFPPEASRR